MITTDRNMEEVKVRINRRITIIASAVVVLLLCVAAGGYFYLTADRPLYQGGITSTLDEVESHGDGIIFRGTIRNDVSDAPLRVHWFFYGVGTSGENAVWPDDGKTMSLYSGSVASDRSISPRQISEGWGKTDSDGLPCHGEEATIPGATTIRYEGALLRGGYDHYWLWIFDAQGRLLHRRKFS